MELFYLSASPFSHRAKWALDHHSISYKITPYAINPFYLMQLPLRLRVCKLWGPITAPILLDRTPGARARVIMDSTEIARWADRCSTQPAPTTGSPNHPADAAADSSHKPRARTLFPAGHAQEMDRWLSCSNQLLSIFRRELTSAGLQHAAVRETLLPPDLLRLCGPPTSLLGRLLRWLMAQIFAMLSTKYSDVDAAADAAQVSQELQAASQLLAAHPYQLLLPEPCGLSWADVALATAINKCVEMQVKLVTPAVPGSAADAVGSGAKVMTRPVLSYMPVTQQLLQTHPELVAWAEATVRREWPQGLSTLHTAGS